MKRIQIIIACLLIISCSSTEPERQKLEISVDDVSCTEVWLKVTGSAGDEVTLKRDGVETEKFTLAGTETVVKDDSLVPNTNYIYTALRNGEAASPVTTATLDTTSHEITWETYTFGNCCSVLFDIAIVDENNIWAGGEIYLNDSTGKLDPILYNAVHWDGNVWKTKRINFYTICGQESKTPYPVTSILPLSKAEVWYSGGGRQTTVFIENKQNEILCMPFSMIINKLWGSSNNNMYAVGDKGNIAHYNGNSWTKLDAGTDTRLLDVYGEGENVFIAGYEDFKPTVLLRYNNGKLVNKVTYPNQINPAGRISGGIRSVWVKGKKLFTLTTENLYRSSLETNGEGEAMWKGTQSDWGVNRVRGTDVNDIFTAGYDGCLWHYNGISWKLYEELVRKDDVFLSISIKDNLVALVGFRYLNGVDRYGLIIIGRR